VDKALNFVLGLIIGLFGLIMAAIALIEGFLRNLMTQLGLSAQLQSAVLIVVAILLILAAVRSFGRLFGALITIFLILAVVHVLLPGLHGGGFTHV
jgi:drug/metabolite transporter superfamily protein YnfA